MISSAVRPLLAVGGRVDTQETKQSALQSCQFGDYDDRWLAALNDFVALDRVEQVDQSTHGGTSAWSAFRIQRKRVQARTLHGVSQFALQKRLRQQGQIIDRASAHSG